MPLAPLAPSLERIITSEPDVAPDIAPDGPPPSYARKAIILAAVILPLAGTLLAMYLLWQRAVHLTDVLLLVGLYAVTGLGVTAGFHRMLTHRSFQAHPAVKALLLILGSMAVEGPALDWAADHTKHHAFSDKVGDPHSPIVN